MIKIEKSNRKTISISINALGDITVKAPLKLPKSDIDKFINSKSEWIKKHLDRRKLILDENSSILNKEKGLYLGKIVDISSNFKKNIVSNAKQYLPARTEFLATKLGFEHGNVSVKDYKARWGSCYKNKDITLCYKLMMLSLDLIDYVIIHELCHTVYFNHQKGFHELLSSKIKNERELNRRLKNYAFLLKIDY